MNGETPLLLSSGKVEHYSAAFYLRNPLADGLPQDSLAIVRERRVADDMHDRIVVQNVSTAPVSFELAVEVASDFADIFAVKEHDFAFGDPHRCQAAARPGRAASRRRRGSSSSTRRRAARRRTSRSRSSATSTAASSATGSSSARASAGSSPPSSIRARTARRRRRSTSRSSPGRRSSRGWTATWDALHHSFERSLADLAALRMRGGSAGHARLPAAGMPWFMTVFGRDTLITSYQTLLLGPELARGALDVLAELQATEDDPSIDAEPGKIVHEVRRGKAAKTWFRRYYGTVDATPLYLVLLSEVWRWTGDDELVATAARAGARARSAGSTRVSTVGVHLLRAAHRARAREPVVEGLGRLAALRRRPHCRAADRAGRGAGLCLRREAPGGRARARGVGRAGAGRAARDRGRRSAGALRRGLLDRRALRAGARRRRRARRLALLERRPPALERDRPRRARRRGRRRADGRRALVGLGRAHDVLATPPPTTRSRTTTERSGPTTTP